MAPLRQHKLAKIEALTCFHKSLMKTHPKSLLALIESCRTLQELKQIHAKSIISGLSYNKFVLIKVVNSSFLTLRSLDYATSVLDRTQEPDLFAYNVLIKAYSSSEIPLVAISLYNKLRAAEGFVGDNYTYPFVLKACAGLFASEKGREAHGTILRTGYDHDRFIMSSLLSFYTVCGEIGHACQVFDEFSAKDIVFWNAMIMGFARAGMVLECFDVFGEMIEMQDVYPNEGTMLGMISVCGESGNLKLGKMIHGIVMKGMGLSGVKLGAGLIDMYVKCRSLDDARTVFDYMPKKNAVVWNSLICGYSQSGSLEEAVDLFRSMHLTDVVPDKFTISSMLSACARTGAFSTGNWVRKFAEKKGIYDVFVGTSLVDMYAKCGYLGVAREVFDQMSERTVTTWNVILSGYASHGQADSAIKLFEAMTQSGPGPDSVTFLAVLHACAHAGLVEQGRQYFAMMTHFYRITPKVEHYGCMVDLFGRAGLLQEAKRLIQTMKIKPNAVVWGSLLSACSIHSNIEIGEWAAHHITRSDAVDGGSYVLLANLSAAAQKFDGVKAVRKKMFEKEILKPPGCSMIEIGDVVHEFVVADKMHPRRTDIYSVLDELSRRLKMSGYVPMVALNDEASHD